MSDICEVKSCTEPHWKGRHIVTAGPTEKDVTVPLRDADVTTTATESDGWLVVDIPGSTGPVSVPSVFGREDLSHQCPDCGAIHNVKKYKTEAEKQAAYRGRHG